MDISYSILVPLVKQIVTFLFSSFLIRLPQRYETDLFNSKY